MHPNAIILSVAAALVVASLSSQAADQNRVAAKAAPLFVKTDKGEIHGKMSEDGIVRTFLGIPYAAPPVGPLRWKPPQSSQEWRGLREATAFGSRCMQVNASPDLQFRDAGPSEDCLTLNVWTPARSTTLKLPVMVWIYGGGLSYGATSEPRQDGAHLATKGVVVVSMNYRLSIFGFLALPSLAGESPQHAAGNYGLLDQVAALQWVRKNIAAFGGDPNNVTIFGESAGSTSVSAQMASPLAKGLFKQAIGESGAAFPSARVPALRPLDEMAQKAAEFTTMAFGTTDVMALRAISADVLTKQTEAAYEPRTRTPLIPNVDGYFLTEETSQIYAKGRQARVPLLAGWNRDEPTGLLARNPQPATSESFIAQAQKAFGDRAEEFLRLYPSTTDVEAARSTIDFASDGFQSFATWEWLEAQAATGTAPVYRYFFERPAPPDKYHPAGSGAFHSDEIEYVFGTLDSRPDAHWLPEDYKLSELIGTYWTNFAKTGNPNGAGMPFWPKYEPRSTAQVMYLDANSHAGADTYRDRYIFLKKAWLGARN